MDNYEQQIIGKAKNFFSQQKEILFAYIYGSMNENSDLDIAVYFDPDNPSAKKDSDWDLYEHLTQNFGKEIDLIILNTAPLELAYSAHKGVLVCENDERARIEFEVNIRKKYWDFVPILRIYFNHSMKGLKRIRKELENAPWSK